MAKKAKGFGEVATDGARPLPAKNSPPAEPQLTWEQSHTRRTFHIPIVLLDRAQAHRERTGESLSKLFTRALFELLERENA